MLLVYFPRSFRSGPRALTTLMSAEPAASALLPTLSCRECRAVGAPVAVDATVGGVALPAVSRLPSCGCYLRKGKASASVVGLITGAPALDAVLRPGRCEPTPVAPSPPAPPLCSGSICTNPAAPSSVRPTLDVEKLRASRELMVYHLECTDEALLGTVELRAEHKLEHLLQMLREELEVRRPISRGQRKPLPRGLSLRAGAPVPHPRCLILRAGGRPRKGPNPGPPVPASLGQILRLLPGWVESLFPEATPGSDPL